MNDGSMKLTNPDRNIVGESRGSGIREGRVGGMGGRPRNDGSSRGGLWR